jgi:hypothetical protein
LRSTTIHGTIREKQKLSNFHEAEDLKMPEPWESDDGNLDQQTAVLALDHNPNPSDKKGEDE